MIKLERLFELQDEVAQEHLSGSESLREMFDFLSECLWLNSTVLTTLRFPPDKQTAIRRLAVDATSHTVVAIRIGLWGDLPESLTMLRSALESCAQLQFVVHEKKYQTAVYEMTRKLDQVSFKSSIAGLGKLGQRIEILHGGISDAAAHATAKRMGLVGYEHGGEYFDRVGFARNLSNAEISLFHCMDASLMVTHSLSWALEQDGEPIPWLDKMNDLNGRFPVIQKECSAKWQIAKSDTTDA